MKNTVTLLVALILVMGARAQVLPPDAILAGRTIPEWSAQWWKWILSIPVSENPGFDYSGEKALQGQSSENVIFLTGLIDDPGHSVIRSVTINEGAYLVVAMSPFFNNSFGADPWGSISEQQRDAGLGYSSRTDNLDGSLDGTALTNLFYTTGQRLTSLYAHRILAPEFSVWMPPIDNVYQYFEIDVAGVFDPGYGDGFWLVLAPLSLGEHELKFYAFATSTSQVTYRLTVKELDLGAAVSRLLPQVALANLPKERFQKLRASLVSAEKLFNAQNFRVGVEQMQRFESQVQLYLQPGNEPLATELYFASERIVIAARRRLGIAPPQSPFETAAPVLQSPPTIEPPPVSSAVLPSVLPREDFWLPNGPVHTVLATNGLVYLGGSFSFLARPNAATAARFDSFSAISEPDFPIINGAVHQIISDGQGGWFLGGEFSLAAGLPRANLVRLTPQRTVDPDWKADTDGAVLALGLAPGTLYVGGSFSMIGGTSRSCLAAVDAASAVVNAWNPGVSNAPIKPNPQGVRALTVARGLLYVAGAFSAIGEVARENLAAIDLESGQATDWQPIVFNYAENTQVLDALLVSGDTAYVGSSFVRSINSVSRNFAAAFDLKRATNNLLPWNPDANGPVLALAASCDKLFLGGSFTTLGGSPRTRLAAVDAVTGAATNWNNWNPGADDAVRALTVSGNLLYAGGQFTHVGDQPRPYLARMDISSASVDTWAVQPAFSVSTMVASGDGVLAGGEAVGLARKNLAALDARTGQPVAWDPSPDGAVYALALSGKKLYIGGDFLNVAGEARNRLASLDSESGAVLDWKPSVGGFERVNAVVESLVVSSSAVYVSGSFTNINSQTRLHLAALDPLTGELLPWNPGANEDVRALRISGNSILAGGRFTQIGGHFRRRLAALDALTGTVLPWNADTDDAVRVLEVSGETVLAGGLFSRIQNFRCGRVAGVDLVSGMPTAWQPQAANTNFIGPFEQTSYVNAITPLADVSFVGGLFNKIGGQARNNLAALELSNGRALDWEVNADQPVIATAYSEGTLYVGGIFRTIAGQFHPNFAVFPPVGSPRIVRHPPNLRVPLGEIISLEAEASGTSPLSYQWELNGAIIPGATGPTLSVASAAIADSGEYVLIATNSLGMVSSRPGIVTVLEPLRIVTQPLSQTVAPGARVTLTVAVVGHPAPSYRWRLNGVNIPGAFSSTLTIPNAQATNGGSYQVAVANLANLGGAVISEIATVVVTNAAVPFADNFTNRWTLTAASGVGSGSNVGATKETGEPKHVGILGGRSVWVGWVAPAKGIATFGTRGSSFDTVLAVYTGTNIADLAPVAADEDHGGFYTSQASFNADAGTEYLIAVDGFSASSGNIVLSWNLDTSPATFPRISQQPLSLVVTQHGTGTFSVVVLTPQVSYQWFLNCLAIPGATNDTLTIRNVTAVNLGNYHVLVQNDTRAAESFDAALEIGPVPGALAVDKVEDVPPEIAAAAVGSRAALRFDPASIGSVSVSVGTIDAQLFNNTGAFTSQYEPLHCGVLGGASVAFEFHAQEAGTLIVDTIGSQIDTVLAVYFKTNDTYLATNFITCDNNGATNGSLVRFGALAGRDYRAYVDGVNAAVGVIHLNWKMGQPPLFPQAPLANPHIRLGESLQLSLGAQNNSSFPAIRFQWLRNGIAIAGATNSTLALNHLLASQSGTYSIVASNDFGASTNAVAVLTVEIPYLTFEPRLTNGAFRLYLQGPPGTNLLLETSTDLTNWTPVLTNKTGQSISRDVPARSLPQQFFRARPRP